MVLKWHLEDTTKLCCPKLDIKIDNVPASLVRSAQKSSHASTSGVEKGNGAPEGVLLANRPVLLCSNHAAVSNQHGLTANRDKILNGDVGTIIAGPGEPILAVWLGDIRCNCYDCQSCCKSHSKKHTHTHTPSLSVSLSVSVSLHWTRDARGVGQKKRERERQRKHTAILLIPPEPRVQSSSGNVHILALPNDEGPRRITAWHDARSTFLVVPIAGKFAGSAAERRRRTRERLEVWTLGLDKGSKHVLGAVEVVLVEDGVLGAGAVEPNGTVSKAAGISKR